MSARKDNGQPVRWLHDVTDEFLLAQKTVRIFDPNWDDWPGSSWINDDFEGVQAVTLLAVDSTNPAAVQTAFDRLNELFRR